MQRALFQTIGLILLVVFQCSFINMAVDMAWLAPNILIVVTVIWVLRQDFRSVLGRIIILGLLFDAVAGGSFGATSLLLVWCAYATSFLSKRFLVEHSGSGLFLAGILVGLYSAVALVIEGLLIHPLTIHPAFSVTSWLVALIPYLPASIFINFCSFFIGVFLITRFTRHSFAEQLDPLFRG